MGPIHYLEMFTSVGEFYVQIVVTITRRGIPSQTTMTDFLLCVTDCLLFQLALAMHWALDMLNGDNATESFIPGVKIGEYLYGLITMLYPLRHVKIGEYF